MAGLSSVVELFEAKANTSTKINHFIYDRVSSVNSDLLKNYPCILLDSNPDRTTEGFNINHLPKRKIYSFRLFIYDTFKTEEQRTSTLQAKQTRLELIFDQYIAEIIRATLTDHTKGFTVQTNGMPGFLAKDVHNDKLIQGFVTITVIVDGDCTVGDFE